MQPFFSEESWRVEKDEWTNLLPQDGEAHLFPDFFTQVESEKFFESLMDNVIWKHEPIKLFGKEIMQPRLTAWIGDPNKNITYSGITMKPQPWTPSLLEIKRKVQTQAEVQFTSALINLYRDGKDSVGWHRDNEKAMGEAPVIASVSFGATRSFQFKHATDKNLRLKIELSNGSLLIMQGSTQKYWFHALAKTTHLTGPRINITFRRME